jgi:zinc transport system substrate-binding protein
MKLRVKPILLILLCTCLVFLTACNKSDGVGEKSGKPVVAVSILPQQTFVKAVCGELAEVVVMVPPGYSPEHYEPTPQDMIKLSAAEVYFSIGVPVEATSVFATLPETTELVSLDEACAKVFNELSIDGERDPHIWLSPKRAAVMVQTIAEAMGGLDPENADTYSANAEKYIAELEAAAAEIRLVLEDIPQRSFIVFHPAFGYFADEFGLNMYALEKNGKEATAAVLMEMADFAKEQGIEIVFYQAEVDSSQSAAFAEEIGGRTVMLDPLSGDYIANLKSMAQAIAKGAEQ